MFLNYHSNPGKYIMISEIPCCTDVYNTPPFLK